MQSAMCDKINFVGKVLKSGLVIWVSIGTALYLMQFDHVIARLFSAILSWAVAL